MTIIETALTIIIAQIPVYFTQRYFFKKIMDKHLDNLEDKIRNKIKK